MVKITATYNRDKDEFRVYDSELDDPILCSKHLSKDVIKEIIMQVQGVDTMTANDIVDEVQFKVNDTVAGESHYEHVYEVVADYLEMSAIFCFPFLYSDSETVDLLTRNCFVKGSTAFSKDYFKAVIYRDFTANNYKFEIDDVKVLDAVTSNDDTITTDFVISTNRYKLVGCSHGDSYCKVIRYFIVTDIGLIPLALQ